MDREGFRNRLNQYKKAREENPGLKYWEWKQKYDSAPQPDSMPGQSQPDLPTVTPQPLDDRVHRWDNEHYVDPVNTVFDADRYRSWKEPALKTFGKRVKFTYRDFMKTADVKHMKFLQSIGRLGNMLKGTSIFSEVVQNLFPSEESERIEDLRVKMDKQNKWLTGLEDIPMYDEGGEVEPDPLEVLERSRPRVAGIPINDRPLSGTDPIGEAMMWGLGGGAASAALRSMFPTYGATAGWLAFGDNGNENALVVKKPLRKGDPTVKPISTGNISEDTRDFYREYVMPLSDYLTEQEKLDFINNNANFMYNVYPESRFDEGVLGFRNKYTGEIALNEKILDDPIIFGRTMAHESDHALEQVKERPRWQTYRINRNSPRTKNQKKTRAGSNSEAYATHEANKWDIINNFELENGRKPTLAEFQLHTDVVPAKTLSSFRNRDSYGRMYEENEIKKLAQKHLTAYDYSKWLDTNKRNTFKYVPVSIPFIFTTNKEES